MFRREKPTPTLPSSRPDTAGAFLLAIMLAGVLPADGAAQPSSRFTVGGRDIVKVDFATTAIGDFPSSLEMVDGIMDVVSKDGQNMLRASSRSVFRIRLPQVLPQDFVLEFDIVPKMDGNPEDLAVEGTSLINQSAASANVLWHRDYLQIVGGGATYDSKVPPSVAAGLPGALTQVVLAMQGETMKLYTNGRLMFTQSNRKFVRGRVLRVFLGGQDDGPNAVHLASLRVVDGVAGAPIVGGGTGGNNAGGAGGNNPGGTGGNNPGGGAGGATNPPSPKPLPNVGGGTTQTQYALGGGGAPVTTIVSNVTVTLGPNGPIVNWQLGAAPAVYLIQRWKADDPQCCKNTSPATPPVTAPPWQDSPPLLSGTYTYRVTATTSSGSAMAGTNFDYVVGTSNAPVLVGGSSAGPRSVNPSTMATVNSPPVAGAGAVAPGFTVSVTMGPNGPVVSWSNAAGATGYRASRMKTDDANCCNTAYGARTFTAASPWQDQPLPMTGTYLYQVVANTPNGQMLAETQFTYQQPATPVGPAPARGSVSAPSAPASPRFAIVNPTPTTAQFSYDVVTSAVGYRIRREVAGSGQWTDLTPTPLAQLQAGFTTSSPYLVDGPLDYRQTYTYELQALQADGTYGTTRLTHTPPVPVDPAGFTATVTGPGQVRLDWQRVAAATTYRISGPGTNGGTSALGNSGTGPGTLSHTLSGLPVGAHTWTIASDYQPGGVLTPSGAWPRVSATIPAPDPAPRYRLVALGIRADRQSRDVNDARDGYGDEVYLTALVNQTTLTRLPLPVVSGANLTVVMTKSLGNEAVSVPYGRIKAGTASATGGIQTGDVVPATLDLMGPTPATLYNNQFPMRLWEGSLEGDAVVVVHPALWEDDVDPRVQANWLMLLTNEARGSYSPQADTRFGTGYIADTRTYDTYKRIGGLSGGGNSWPFVYYDNEPGNTSRILGSELFQCTTILGVLVRRPCEAHGVDRPIGLWGPGHPGSWSDLPIVLTKAGVEKLLNDRTTYPQRVEPLGPATFVVWLHDKVGEPAVTEAIAQYRLYLRLERVP